MERTFSQDDRIRRAEEIYARRQRLNKRVIREPKIGEEQKNFKLLKRVFLQMIICVIIYYIFYLINTTNYSFSESTLNKTKDLISHDYDFYSVYSSVVESINNFLYSDEKTEEKTDESTDNNEEIKNENITQNTEANAPEVLEDKKEENIAEINNDESLTQTEVVKTEESENERIKNKYAFALPVTRNSFI